jgi:hypothetical protein
MKPSDEVLNEIKAINGGKLFYETSHKWTEYLVAVFRENLDKELLFKKVTK